MHGWHESYNEFQGPDVICGHLATIADPPVPAVPPDACGDCVAEGRTAWIELRKCLVCGQTRCCESSERQHAKRHFEQTGHSVFANQSGGPAWGWCYDDGIPLTPDA
jgi:monovalent cation/hydrogen antiporter